MDYKTLGKEIFKLRWCCTDSPDNTCIFLHSYIMASLENEGFDVLNVSVSYDGYKNCFMIVGTGVVNKGEPSRHGVIYVNGDDLLGSFKIGHLPGKLSRSITSENY